MYRGKHQLLLPSSLPRRATRPPLRDKVIFFIFFASYSEALLPVDLCCRFLLLPSPILAQVFLSQSRYCFGHVLIPEVSCCPCRLARRTYRTLFEPQHVFSAPSQFDDLDSALVASVDHMEQSNLSSLEAASRDSELVVLQVSLAWLDRLLLPLVACLTLIAFHFSW